MKKTIVTGASGFLGSAVILELAASGIPVFAVYKDSADIPAGLPEMVTPVVCDMQNAADLQSLISDSEIDCFYHFAWQGSAGPLRADSAVQLQNVSFSLTAVVAAAAIGCGRFVFASSIMEYELQKTMEAGFVPASSHIYSAAKLAVRQMGAILAKEKGIAFIPVVISNIFGEGETSPRLINTTIRKLLHNEPTAFTEGTQTYDFLYIRDAVGAFIAIGERGIPFKEYYLGSLSPRPLRDFLLELNAVVSDNADLGLGKLSFTGISLDYSQLFDIEAVKNDTGFLPRYSFAEGIKNTAEWLREKGEGNDEF